jgi:Family of unknown function (DUF6914)
MPEKNKNCMYITLQHRMGKPGYHWAILLAPKHQSTDFDIKDSHLFHVTNTYLPEFGLGQSGIPDWRYEHKPANSMRSRALVARLLIAKLPASTMMDTHANRINEILRQVPVVQNDPEWTCQVWVKNALAALRQSGGDLATIPALASESGLESEIVEFGERAKAKVLKMKTPITDPSVLPFKDIRVR